MNQKTELQRSGCKLSVVIMGILLVILAGCSQAVPTTDFSPDPDLDLESIKINYSFIYEEWANSVHGQAFLEGDKNSAACNDCHANPEKEEILAGAFRLDTPARCARCHDNNELMAEYEISDDVYETYLADFHGTTIEYYHATTSETIRDEAVCSDCHGSHGIYPSEDARSLVSEDNLPGTCQKCHPGAAASLAGAYGHYRPIQSPASSTADSPIVFIVKLVYQALIPITLGGMLGYIVLDLRYRILNSNKSGTTVETSEEPS
jgi:hypothetical protein